MANAKQCDRCGEFYVDMPKSEIDFLTNEYAYVAPLSTIKSIQYSVLDMWSVTSI